MKLNYCVGGFVIVITLFLNSLGLTQQIEGSSNPKGVNESQSKYIIGLRTNSEPISYRDIDGDDKVDNFKGYCHAFIEILKQNFHLNIETVAVLRYKRFSEQGVDATCGPDTITQGRKNVELLQNGGNFSKPFAMTRIAVLLEKKNENTLLSLTTKQDLKIGVISGTTTKIAVKAFYPILDKNIVEFDNFTNAITNLTSGKETIA